MIFIASELSLLDPDMAEKFPDHQRKRRNYKAKNYVKLRTGEARKNHFYQEENGDSHRSG